MVKGLDGDTFLVTVTSFKDKDRSENPHLVRSTRKQGAVEAVNRYYQQKVDTGEIDSFVVHFHETISG